jgi:hypothetical protein
VFDSKLAAVALRREGKYICGGNFFWQGILDSPTPGVPMRLERVMELGNFLFGSGKDLTHLPNMITVLVDNADYPIMAHKGSLKRVSPEEPCHAAIFMCADDIARLQHDTNPEAKQRLMRWRQIFLSCCFCFEVTRGDDAMYWRAYNLRQLVTAEYGAVRRTAWQMAYELALFKKAKEQETGHPLTKKQVTDLYQANGTTAKDSDAITENYVGTALSVYDKICCVPRLAECLESQEATYNMQSCFNTMSNLSIIINKTDDVNMRTWVMESIVDSCRSGQLNNDEITKGVLTGGSATVSLCTLLQFKRQVITRYLNQEFTVFGVDHEDLHKFRDVTKDHASYRHHVKPFNGDADTTWLGRCKPSSILALRLVEACTGGASAC